MIIPAAPAQTFSTTWAAFRMKAFRLVTVRVRRLPCSEEAPRELPTSVGIAAAMNSPAPPLSEAPQVIQPPPISPQTVHGVIRNLQPDVSTFPRTAAVPAAARHSARKHLQTPLFVLIAGRPR